MRQFNVIIFNINRKKFEPYDIIPHLVSCYDWRVEHEKEYVNDEEGYFKVPKTRDEFKAFIKRESQYMWWARCEWEIILSDWPPAGIEEKWDVHQQVMMNLDIITDVLMESLTMRDIG